MTPVLAALTILQVSFLLESTGLRIAAFITIHKINIWDKVQLDEWYEDLLSNVGAYLKLWFGEMRRTLQEICAEEFIVAFNALESLHLRPDLPEYLLPGQALFPHKLSQLLGLEVKVFFMTDNLSTIDVEEQVGLRAERPFSCRIGIKLLAKCA